MTTYVLTDDIYEDRYRQSIQDYISIRQNRLDCADYISVVVGFLIGHYNKKLDENSLDRALQMKSDGVTIIEYVYSDVL